MSPTTKTTTPDLDELAERLEHARAFEARLWAGSPDVGRARARLARLPAALGAVGAALNVDVATVSAVTTAAIDRVLDGEPLDPDKLRADVMAAVTAGQVAEAVNAAVAGRSHDARAEVEQAERAAANDALAVLGEALAELVEVGRALLPLCEVSGTLRDAARAGQARALLAEAVNAHDVLRARQQVLTKSYTVDAAALVRQFGIVRDVSTMAPWAERLTSDGWAGAPNLEDLVLEGGEPLFLLVCRPDLQAWVPTEEQLREAEERMRAKVEQARWAALHPAQNVDAFDDADRPRFSLTVDGKSARPEQTVRSSVAGSRRTA